jgi:hypothetical protein
MTLPGTPPRNVSGRVVVAACVLSLCPALPADAGAQTLPNSEDCRTCHLSLEDDRLVEPARAYDEDIHAETGFGCLACHGSAGDGRLDPSAGFLSKPVRREIPGMCGRCHSDAAFMRQFDPAMRVDQVAEYWTSGHGKRLQAFNDSSVATCIDCHPAHRIRPPSDPVSTVHPSHVLETCARCHADPERMAGREIGTTQVEQYRESVHGQMLAEGDLSAPVCNDCHGNHGAAPPGVSSVRNVCGQCHSVMADYFDQSGHEEVFNEHELPGCATCHGKHDIERTTDAALGTRAREVCAQCHEPGDPNGQVFDRIAIVLDSLGVAADSARAILEEAEGLGMEVSQALFELEDVTNAQLHARTAIHTFSLEPVREQVAEGLAITGRAEERGQEALSEHRFRRVGLGVSTSIIALLIVALLMKIRQMEKSTLNTSATTGGRSETV